MKKTKKCRRCKNEIQLEDFVDVSGNKNPRGQYCQQCHLERVEEWRLAALDEEATKSRKLKIVYGEFWKHYACPEEFYTTLENERDFCPYCGTIFREVVPHKFNESRIHLDHMDPLDRGGEHSIRNVVFCCGPCNIRKGKQTFLKWLTTLQTDNRVLSGNIYLEKHGHPPEEFIEGCNFGRGTRDLEFATDQTEEELRRKFPNPIVNAPPSNQPITITLNVMDAIERLPEELKQKLLKK